MNLGTQFGKMAWVEVQDEVVQCAYGHTYGHVGKTK